MRNLVIASAAALVLGTGAAFAAEPPCSLTSDQSECAINIGILAFGNRADQDIDQRQNMEFWGDHHTANGQVQRQDGINLSVLTYNVDQDIEQHQSLKARDDVNGERPNQGHDAVTQTQFGVNVSLLSANGDQSIHQGQSLNNWTGDETNGAVQNQGAANIQVGSTNDQSISQHQSVTYHN